MPELTRPRATIQAGEVTVQVTPLDKRIWDILSAVPGAVIPYDVISRALWPDEEPKPGTIRQRIGELRSRLGVSADIETFRGASAARVSRIGKTTFLVADLREDEPADARVATLADDLRLILQARPVTRARMTAGGL